MNLSNYTLMSTQNKSTAVYAVGPSFSQSQLDNLRREQEHYSKVKRLTNEEREQDLKKNEAWFASKTTSETSQ
jgi:hypothetical protein